MKGIRAYLSGAWTGRFLVLGCIIVLPFLRFLLQNRYNLFHTEVAVAVALLALSCLVLSLAAGRKWSFWLVTLLCIVVMSATSLQTLIEPVIVLRLGWLCLLISAVLAPAMLRMREKFFHILLVFTLGSFAVDIVLFIAPRRSDRVFGHSVTGHNTRFSHVLYLVLDEHIGPEGVPDAMPQGQQAKRRIEETFAHYNFRIYPYAFSNYAATLDSIPSILNGRLLERRSSYFISEAAGPRWGVYSLRQNRLFAEYLARGYAVNVYQHRSIDFCAPGLDVHRRIEYSDRLESLNSLRGPWTEHLKWIVGNYQRSDAVLARMGGFFPFRFRARMVGPLAAAEIWPNLLEEDIVAADRNTLFFAHLMTPHRPYVYRADGRIRNLDQWSDDDLDPSFDRHVYQDRYHRYFEQVEHLSSQLDGFFRFLRQSDLLDSMLIIVHGDHGPRIRLVGEQDRRARQDLVARKASMDQYDYVSSPQLEDLLNRFSTLLAIKLPGARVPERVEEKGSVLKFLREALAYRTAQLDEGIDSVYLYDGDDRPRPIRLVDLWIDDGPRR